MADATWQVRQFSRCWWPRSWQRRCSYAARRSQVGCRGRRPYTRSRRGCGLRPVPSSGRSCRLLPVPPRRRTPPAGQSTRSPAAPATRPITPTATSTSRCPSVPLTYRAGGGRRAGRGRPCRARRRWQLGRRQRARRLRRRELGQRSLFLHRGLKQLLRQPRTPQRGHAGQPLQQAGPCPCSESRRRLALEHRVDAVHRRPRQAFTARVRSTAKSRISKPCSAPPTVSGRPPLLDARHSHGLT